MKKRSINPEVPALLRQKAEEQLSNRKPETNKMVSEADMLKLIHELEVHQIELELQNEELVLANNKAIAATEKYEELYDFAPSGYFMLSREGKILEINLRGAKLLGKERSLLINSRFDSFIKKESRGVFIAFLEEVFQGKNNAICDVPLSSKDNNCLYVHLTGIISENSEQCLVTATDITERKIAEDELRINLAKYKVLIDTFPIGITISDSAGNIVETNEKAVEILGLSREEHLKRKIKGEEWKIIKTDGTIFPPDEYASVKALKENRLVENIEMGIVKSEDEITWINVTAAPVPIEDYGVLIAYNDITQRKILETELKVSEERYNLAMKATNDGLFDWNLETNEIYFSPGWKKMLGYEDDELPNDFSVWEKTTDPEDVKKSWELQQKLITKQTDRFVMEFKMKHKDGHWVDILSRAEAFFNNSGKAIRMVGTHTDITKRKQAEEALRKSETIKNTMVSNIGDVIVIIDKNGINQYKSPNVSKLFGWKPEELIGKSAWDNGHPDDLEAAQNFLVTIATVPNATGTTEMRYKRKDGKYVWIEISVINLLHDKDIQGILGNYRDITERKQAEEELRESEERFRSIFDKSPVGSVIVGLDKIFIKSNTAFCNFIGYTNDELIGKTISDITYPEDMELGMLDLKLLTEGEIESATLQKRYLHKDGAIIWGEITISLVRDSNNKPLYFLPVIKDITKRKQAEAVLQERTELLQNITNHMFDMVAITDLTGVYTYAGPSHRILGFEPGQLPGTNVFDYLHPEDANYVANEFRELITDPSPKTTRTLEYRQRCLDGSYLWLETIGKILFNNNGTPSSLFFSSRNVTERKMAEEAIRKSEADLKHQTRLQKLLMDISNTYINVGEEDLDQTINKSLAELGEFMGADRCYIFEYDYDRQVTNNTHEWCADGIEPQIDQLQATPLGLYSVWLEANQKDETVYIHDILKLPEGDSTRNFLEPQGIKSLIAVPITDSGRCTGFIGFDSVCMHHIYTKTEDSLLRVFAQMLVSVKKRLSYEQQIRESHEKYQIVAENTISWEFWEAPDGEFLYHSPSCEKIIGHKAEDLLKNPGLFFEMIHPDDLKAYNIHLKEGRKHNGLRKHYFRIINSKGETRNIEHQCLSVYGSNGAYLGIRGSNVDITERKQAEEAILHGRQRLESFLEISRSITSTLDQEKIMQMVVDNAIRIMGLGSGAIYLQNDEETIKLTATSPALPDDFPDVFRIASLTDHPHIAKTIATGSYQLLADSSTAELSPAEKEIVKLRGLRSNLYLPISLRDKMIGVLILSSVEETYHFADEEIQLLQGFANQAAHIIGNISHFTELRIYAAELEQQISQRKQIEKALRESEHFANSIANNTPALIYLFDLETGANLWSNNLHKRFFSNLDAHDSELALDEISKIIHPEDLRVLFDKKAELNINKDVREFQQEIRINEKGTWKWMNSLTSIFKRDEQGKATQILGVLFDIDDRKKAEEAIKQNEERFRQVAETNQTVIWEINTEGIYTYVSPMAEKIWGYDPADVVGKVNYFNLHPEEGRQEFKEQTMKLITETGCFNELANPIQKPDGSIIWVSSNGLSIYDEHGNLTGYRGSDQDITERLLAEKELRKFKTISDQSNYGAAITDLNGKLLYVNDQFAQMHGWNSKDLIHESLNILHNEQQLPKVNELLQELKAEGSMASMEVGHVRKDGSVFPTLMNASIIYDEHNLPIFMASTVIDITEITAAKLELLKLTQAVVQNPASIIITDPEGSIEYANPRFIEMMGYEAGEVIGEKSKLFLEGVIPDEMQKELLSTIRNGDVWKSEFENTKKNGEVFWENVSISPIKNETGDIVNFVAIMEDISERKELMEDLTNAKEKAQESDKLKTHFMNNISHEVRTPLNGILGFGDIMMQEGLTRDERLVYHKILIQSSNRLMKTIDDIMDISLINEGLIKPMFSAFLLPDLLESFIDRLKENCASGNIFVSLEIPPNAKDMVIHSDREMLGKILWQLLSNAAKFTSQGKINYGFLNLKNETQFYVKDTGQGIAADKLEVIFKPFVQEDVSSTRGYEGSGLGITIARGLVEVLGGKLWVESKKSKGTSVFFTLPLIRVKPEKEPVVNKTPRLQVLDNPVILIAEDDESNYQLMKAVIQRAGYSTLHAYNGADAVEFCHKFPEISLVFMDMKMPVMHGLEATALIKAFRPELPVVAVTAYAQTGDRQKMLQAGCDEYLAKPVKVNDLKDMIKKML